MSEEKAARERRPFETWLFETMRLGPIGGAAAILFVIYGLYLVMAALWGPSLIDPGTAYRLSVPAWAALILSLIFSVALSTMYYARRAPIDEREALREALSADPDAYAAVRRDATEASRAERVAFWAGVLPGLAMAYPTLDYGSIPWREMIEPGRLWFTIAIPASIGLLFRAITGSLLSDRLLNRVVRSGYRHDPLAPERSFVFGRIALRGALTWFLIAGVIVLFFVRGAGGLGALFTVSISVLGALSALLFPLAAVRRQIRAAKEAELDKLHAAMRDARRGALDGDAGEAQRLGGLAAYEQTVRTSPDWPVSAPVTTRFFLYILIPIVPWFGSAMAERIVMEMAR